jgi:hypothetical protein
VRKLHYVKVPLKKRPLFPELSKLRKPEEILSFLLRVKFNNYKKDKPLQKLSSFPH